MYCVEWKTRKASPARKSRDESRPATGRSRNPVHAVESVKYANYGQLVSLALMLSGELRDSHCRKRDTSSSCGMLSSL